MLAVVSVEDVAEGATTAGLPSEGMTAVSNGAVVMAVGNRTQGWFLTGMVTSNASRQLVRGNCRWRSVRGFEEKSKCRFDTHFHFAVKIGDLMDRDAARYRCLMW